MDKKAALPPKKILLVSNSKLHHKTFEELCENKEFVICRAVRSIVDLKDLLSSKDFNIFIIASKLGDTDMIAYLHEHSDTINPNVPLVFILNEEPSEQGFKYLTDLNVNLLYDKYMSLSFLNYSLKSAVRKQKTSLLLKENELRYRSLYDHTLDINLIVNDDWQIIDTNVQGRKKLKLKTSLPLKNIFQKQTDYVNFINLLAEVEQVSWFETSLKIGRKNVICIVDAFARYDVNQNKSGAHIVIRDIDESRKSQNLAIQANKLMVTGKFLRSLAHEIRNPLTNINLALDQVQQESELDEDARLYMDVLKRSSNRIRDLLEEIMNAYKTSEVVFGTNSLHNVIDLAARFANDRLLLKNIKLTRKLKLKNDVLQADKVKLTTAILNLIVNATEAINHDSGHIHISTNRKGDSLLLKIKDNGYGMNDEQVQALFDPFYTGKSKGLGLGLTTAQNVIFAHKGSISVESKEGRGTTFSITLPRKV